MPIAVSISPAALLRWITTPLSGAEHHHLPMWAAWHGRLMVAAWGILVPIGILAARYFKIWPGEQWPSELDDQRWWHAHRLLQCAGMVLAIGALLLVWHRAQGATPVARWHAILGWTVLALGGFQVAGGLLRGTKGGPTDRRARTPLLHGDHYLMTRRRVLFEWSHKLAGYLAIGLTFAVVPLGLVVADAPRWMPLVIAVWWLLLAVAAVRLQRAGRCVDTYEAIWGAGDNAPGRNRRPIGWGIRRQ